MTEKEKAEAYDEAIERAKKLYGNGITEEIFTELKECDDEKIKRWIIDDIRYNMDNEPLNNSKYKKEAEKAIAWLEKQGKKSTAKIEPRFKVGDWVVRGDTIAQILDIQEQYYVGLDINGKDFVSSRFLNDDKIHLWTIQDAKDGDVIFYDEGWICIFKCIHGIWYSSYCFITDDGEFHTGYERHAVDSTIHGNAHPATKEQRDILMKAMNDAGYEWDAEKKELKKKSKIY